MAEEFEGKSGERPDFSQYWSLARRRYWYFLVPFFIGWAAMFAVSWLLPAIYRSGTLILVQQPSVPQQYVVPNVSSNLQDRLDSITQQILSRTRLLTIIDKLKLYPDEQARGIPDAVVERMRQDIEIELVRSTEGQQVTAFNIYYKSKSPKLAQDVTSELTNLFINENLQERQQQSEHTTQFLEDQLSDARQNLAQQEQRLRQYKDQYLGELPGQLQSNIQILSGLQAQLQSEQDALGQARQQNAYLQSLLSQYQNLETAMSAGGSTTTPVGLPAIDQELDRLRAQLADLSSHYTEKHPDVRKLKEQIAKTEKMKEKMTADLKAAAESRTPDTQSSGPVDMGDPRQASAVVEVRSQLQANQIEISNRQRSIKELESKIAEYQGRLNRTPVREQQLADITRDYDQSRTNYESLLAKKNQSELATNMEKQQQGETFRMIDPPSLPGKPYSPNRFKLACIGLVVGIVLGGGTAGLAEIADDRIHSEAALKEVLTSNVIVEIPPILTPTEEKARRYSNWTAVAAAVVVVAVLLAGTAVSFLKG